MRPRLLALTLGAGLLGLAAVPPGEVGACPPGFYGGVVYYSAAPVYYPPAYYAPRAYYAAPMYQRPYGYPPAYGPRAAAPAGPATTVSVGAYDNYFEPRTITVQPGTTVRWVNQGKHPHTVTANDGRWDSGDIPPGGSYTATFQQPGTYSYYCRHHTNERMQGTIVVGAGGGPGGSRPPGY
jgi:plastocyanin